MFLYPFKVILPHKPIIRNRVRKKIKIQINHKIKRVVDNNSSSSITKIEKMNKTTKPIMVLIIETEEELVEMVDYQELIILIELIIHQLMGILLLIIRQVMKIMNSNRSSIISAIKTIVANSLNNSNIINKEGNHNKINSSHKMPINKHQHLLIMIIML